MTGRPASMRVIRLYGRTAGAAVWPLLKNTVGGDGRVLAVYRRSLLWLAGPGFPLTLSADPGQRGPLVLEVEGGLAWLDGVRQGDPVIRCGRWLHVGQCVQVDLVRLVPWSLPMPHLTPETAGSLAEAIAHVLRAREPPAGDLAGLVLGRRVGAGWLRSATQRVAALYEGLTALNPTRVDEAVQGLVGLGHGLTPSGDDLLVGALAALESLGEHAPRADQAWRLLRRALTRAAARTTTTSRQFMRWAVRGYYGETVRAVFAAAAQGQKPQLIRAIQNLLNVGATSGADTLAGIWLGTTAGLQCEFVLHSQYGRGMDADPLGCEAGCVP